MARALTLVRFILHRKAPVINFITGHNHTVSSGSHPPDRTAARVDPDVIHPNLYVTDAQVIRVITPSQGPAPAVTDLQDFSFVLVPDEGLQWDVAAANSPDVPFPCMLRVGGKTSW